MTTKEVYYAEPLELVMAARLGEVGTWEPRAQAVATILLLELHGHTPRDWNAADAKVWLASLKGG